MLPGVPPGVLQAGLHINGSYAEVWLPKAVKQWLFFEGGEEALGGWYALATVLDGEHVCSKYLINAIASAAEFKLR